MNFWGGEHTICKQADRLTADCGPCGPHWGNLDKCKQLCDGTDGCTHITWFYDNGCQLFSACEKPTSHYYGGGKVKSFVMQKTVSGGARRLPAAAQAGVTFQV